VSEWRGASEHAWELYLDDLESLLTARTRVVVVNFPHNLTGYLPPSEFVGELSALSDRHGFIIFSDEVSRGLELDPSDRLPAFADVNERAVSLGVMSKTYGLAGLRIGWLATRDDGLFRELAAFKDYTTICNSAPSEFLGTLALRNAEAIVERNLRIVRGNLDCLDHFFGSHRERFDWYRPRAGSVAFPTLLRGTFDEFCADPVERAGVLLLPGTLYGEGFNAFRIGFACISLARFACSLSASLDALNWNCVLGNRYAKDSVDNSCFAGNSESEEGAGSQLSTDHDALSGRKSSCELGCDSQ
jgi:aspartate/methionine/tyrosine aminotransferase